MIYELTLVWPPTVNNYWLHIRNRKVLSARARKFQDEVAQGLIDQIEIPKGKVWKPIEDKLFIEIDAYPPDRRKRDLDNIVKPLFDAMEVAEFMVDDNQIDYFHVRRMPVVKGGCVKLKVTVKS